MLTGLAILFFLMDAGGKLIAPATMIAYSPPLGVTADNGFYQMLGIYLGLILWGGLWLRDARLRSVFPVVR